MIEKQHSVEDWSRDLQLIEDAACEAGAIALAHFGESPEVWWKNGGQSPVSAADFAANACLEAILRKARPEYGWLSEESDDDPARLGAECAFVVDPIDGTRGFLGGHKTWAVSVAIVCRNRPVAGVLVAPALDEIYRACLGRPALKNGTPIKASVVTGENDDTQLGLCLPNNLAARFDQSFRARLKPVTYIPSLAYRLAMVADGRLDGTLVRTNSHDWDLAAADIILSQSGAVLTNSHGGELFYNRSEVSQGTLFAGNHALISTLLHQINPVSSS